MLQEHPQPAWELTSYVLQNRNPPAPPCPDQLLLQDVHKLQQILRMAVSNVVNCIWWNRKPILSHLFLWGSLHHPLHTLYNVIHISKITLTVSIIENLNGLIITKFIGKSKICHIRTTGRSIHNKETKSCRRNIIKLRICMSHQLIRLLSCRIKRNRIIHFILCGIRHLLIRTIDRRTGCIYQMLHSESGRLQAKSRTKRRIFNIFLFLISPKICLGEIFWKFTFESFNNL